MRVLCKVVERGSRAEDLRSEMQKVVQLFEQYIKLNKKIPPEVLVSINQIDDPAKLADTVASHLTLKIDEKQELLEVRPVVRGPDVDRSLACHYRHIGGVGDQQGAADRILVRPIGLGHAFVGGMLSSTGTAASRRLFVPQGRPP